MFVSACVVFELADFHEPFFKWHDTERNLLQAYSNLELVLP
jgi:hypothetical protein